jgi:RNA recognition motif-containing protein
VSNNLNFIPALNFSKCEVYVSKHICLQVLFVKNLSNRVKEVDLVSVFGHLDDQCQKRIIYRLMTGRMKGQAFITFPSM